MRKPPAEIVASALAVTTLFLPHHLPPWAIFIGWAGTFAAGGPKPAILKRIWPTMALGNCVACLSYSASASLRSISPASP